jgi:hypothetical protein
VSPGASADQPDRSLRWHPEQPLHLAPGNTYPVQAPAAQNYFAGVVRWQPSRAATLGLTFTSAVPMTRDCSAEEAALPDGQRPGRCEAVGGNALGIDWNLRTSDSEWVFYGQLDASQVVGGPPTRLLPDGTALNRLDGGAGFYLAAKRQGGEPWRVDVRYEFASPRLDLNPSGYQPTQNQHGPTLTLRYVRPSGGGPFLSYGFGIKGQAFFTSDGRSLNRGNLAALIAEAQLRNFTKLECEAGVRDPRYDVREIRATGIAYLRPPWVFLDCQAASNPSLPYGFEAWISVGRYLTWGPLQPSAYADGQATVVARPHPGLETRLGLQLERNTYQARYIQEYTQPGTYFFGDLLTPVMSVVLRQLVVLTPRLTLQLYAQLYTDYLSYQRFYRATSAGAPVRPSDLRPIAAADLPPTGDPTFTADQHHTTLNLNLVLRWEYRLGSTLYLVYARQASELPWLGPSSPPASLAPRALGPGPSVDTLLLKWTYWWNP